MLRRRTGFRWLTPWSIRERSDTRQGPLVSAICVSHSSRLGLLQRAALNFFEQQYQPKELLLVVNQPGYADTIAAFLRRLASRDEDSAAEATRVRILVAGFKTTTQACLHAMTAARGEVFVAWDDDNLSHPERLGWQLSQTSRERPSVLSECLYYFYDSDELFVTNFSQPEGSVSKRCALGSLMFYRDAYRPLEMMRPGLWTESVLACYGSDYDFILGEPWQFLTGSNGDNFRGAEEHRRLGSMLPAVKTAQELQCDSQLVCELDRKLLGYRFPQACVDVVGKDAAACCIHGVRTWPEWFASPLPPEDWQLRLPSPERRRRLQALQPSKLQRKVASAAVKPEQLRKTP